MIQNSAVKSLCRWSILLQFLRFVSIHIIDLGISNLKVSSQEFIHVFEIIVMYN